VTKILFDSDYSQLNAEDVISALADDPRLVFVDKEQLFASSLTRLATTFKLSSSYGKIYSMRSRLFRSLKRKQPLREN
jgi:hypothetical protein